MTLPDVDFKLIRLHRGSREDAFEELCCQLAGEEELSPPVVRFDRKGRGADGGVECFASLSDGTETCWQVKYYWETKPALKSLDESLDQALSKHPKMSRFVACLPFDLADSRKDGVKTALQLWTEWKEKRESRAKESGRNLLVERWDAHELKKRLMGSSPSAAGKIAFWFDSTLLSPDWLERQFKRTRAELGERYSPESHIDLPIRRSIDAVSLDSRLFDQLSVMAGEIRLTLASTDQSNGAAVLACEAALAALDGARCDRNAKAVEELRARLASARSAVAIWHGEMMHGQEVDAEGFARPTASLRALSGLVSAIRVASRELQQDHWNLVGARSLLVVGDAGSGKSHLLADACDSALNNGRPALLLLGGKLADAEPWGEMLKGLDLAGSFSSATFLGALNAAGEAAGARALLIVDALNEGNGQRIWPSRLAALAHDVARFEWVALVMSCRTGYLDMVVPAELDARALPRVEHRGFSVRQARLYLQRRGIRLAEEPSAVRELESPLFIKICCDSLNLDGQDALKSSLGGVSAIFGLYTRAVVKKVTLKIRSNPAMRRVEKAIAALVDEMADVGNELIDADRAYCLVSPPGGAPVDVDHDVLFQLQSEGLLATQPLDGHEYYRFTFQRVGDYQIAERLLSRSVKGGDVEAAFSASTPLRAALFDESSMIAQGVLEALAVQLPERFGVELLDISELGGVWGREPAFRASILARDMEAIRERTWELIEEVGGSNLRFETMISLASEPGFSRNAEALHAELSGLAMPERDAGWSLHLADPDAPSDGGHAERLIDWLLLANQDLVQQERAALAALQLCWFFTTSNRSVRDTATKALVAVLADRPGLALELWRRFQDLDDPYVTERIACSIYGAALQGQWADQDLSAAVLSLHSTVFLSANFLPNALTRDHVSGLVGYADSRRCLPAGLTAGSPLAAVRSAWADEYVSDAQIATYTRTYNTGHVHTDEIVGSAVNDGDFARYQIDRALDAWSATPLDEATFLTVGDVQSRWEVQFRQSASPEAQKAYDELQVVLQQAQQGAHWEFRDQIAAARAVFLAAAGQRAYDIWCAEASPWWQQGTFGGSVAKRAGQAAGFNLRWARMWVCKRAHDLGWSEHLHGAFDLSTRSDRHNHKVERIGKKYQWIALYELCARVADNFKAMPSQEFAAQRSRLRNIDPSLLISQTGGDGGQASGDGCFWIPRGPDLAPASLDESVEWLVEEQDVVAGLENIEVTDDRENRRWLVLSGFSDWKGESAVIRRDTWRRISCMVVRAPDLDRALALLGGNHFQGEGDFPVARSGGLHSYLGEHPWVCNLGDGANAGSEWINDWNPHYWTGEGETIGVLPTTASYLLESSEYDASITESISLDLPAKWLMDALELKLIDGASVQYGDAADIVRFMDPSVAWPGRSAALIDRSLFLEYLQANQLVAIWALSGDKGVYGTGGAHGFGGRWTFTQIFYSKADELTGLARYETHEKPSSEQLQTLRGREQGLLQELVEDED
ncbi:MULTISPECIES: hypothetical protein [unclassified Stenotrophomonas]|uniref:hypothetical protein n=2 Tax=Stenotrophomonas TaxID=40323 RepID=UPI0018D3788C|nr:MULTISPECIES: hypothetical protein [unclassified Stenotrophomonas]MBH1574377.1 hypothetical protein [Stenotrophomonas maltophilia]MCM2991608.1 hypothetical protein [Stenotrophomonas maltophilia]